MPPKKKGKEKKGKDSKKKKKTDGSNAEATPEELARLEGEKERKAYVTEADKIFHQTTKEELDFNEYQQQREKLNYFWIVEKKKLDDKKAELRNKERELQDLEERHQVEVKVYKQRIKHLLFEQQDEITHLKTDAETTLKITEESNKDSRGELSLDRRGLKLDLKEMEITHEDYLTSLKQDQDKKISLLRHEFERIAKELQQKYERKRKVLREKCESERKSQTLAIEEHKNSHIASLMHSHEKAFGEIKNYYNDITHNNLDLIKSLKEEVGEMKKKEAQDEKLMFEIAQENKRMSEPLKKALMDVERLRENLKKYKSDKTELLREKAQLLVKEDEYKSLAWEHEVYLQRSEHVVKEKNELYEKFHSSVYDVQQKTGFKNLILEKKLSSMDDVLEQKEAQLNEVLAHAQLDPSVLGQVKGRLDDILESKNQSVRDLELELERVESMHHQLSDSTKAKLEEYGIPEEELGFVPQIDKSERSQLGASLTT